MTRLKEAFQRFNLLTIDDLVNAFGVHKRTLMRWIEVKGFPKPIRLVGSKKVWKREEVIDWLRRNNDSTNAEEILEWLVPSYSSALEESQQEKDHCGQWQSEDAMEALSPESSIAEGKLRGRRK